MNPPCDYPSEPPADWLVEILRSHPAGLGEYELLKRLREAGQQGYGEDLFHDSLSLFRGHFQLFHALHKLRDRLASERLGRLEISPLCIRLGPWQATTSHDLDTPDAMREYYLDPHHLFTPKEPLEQLLGAFWSGFHARQQRQAALDTLGLKDPVDRRSIRERYRRLAMRHHPDRGGEADRFHAIRQAMELLRRCGD